MRREANRMVPASLLKALRDAQREEVDGPEAKAVVRQIDHALRDGGPRARGRSRKGSDDRRVGDDAR